MRFCCYAINTWSNHTYTERCSCFADMHNSLLHAAPWEAAARQVPLTVTECALFMVSGEAIYCPGAVQLALQGAGDVQAVQQRSEAGIPDGGS
jgi:hypothetical protein